MRTTLRSTVLALTLLAGIPAAQAAHQTYSFQGSLNALQFSGSFSFDDSQLTVFDPSVPLLTVAPLTELSMSYGNTSYTLDDALAAPDVSYYDSAFLGLSYSNDAMTFIAGSFDVSDAYVTDGLNTADVIYARVPEPETFALVLLGLGLLGAVSRRRAKAA